MTLTKKITIGYLLTILLFVAIFFTIPRVIENPTKAMQGMGLLLIGAQIVTIMAATYFLIELILFLRQKKKVSFTAFMLVTLSILLYFLYN